MILQRSGIGKDLTIVFHMWTMDAGEWCPGMICAIILQPSVMVFSDLLRKVILRISSKYSGRESTLARHSDPKHPSKVHISEVI